MANNTKALPSILSVITTELLAGIDDAAMTKLVPRLIDHLVFRGHDRRKVSMDVKDFFANPSSIRSEDGASVKIVGKVIIITDYATTCMAIIGDISAIEGDLYALNDNAPGCSTKSSRLAYGPGWLVQNGLLGVVRKILGAKSIDYECMTNSLYSANLR